MVGHHYRLQITDRSARPGGVPTDEIRGLLDSVGPGIDAHALRRASRTLHARGRISSGAVLAVLSDLALQGWDLVADGGDLVVAPPSSESADGEDARVVKSRVRAGLESQRAEEIASPAVRLFFREAETRRVHCGRRTSILDLVDDGQSLARSLREAWSAGPVTRLTAFRHAVDPVIEVVVPGVPCGDSGILLTDIWRYFRHTWTLPYRSVPGRTLAFLVRNQARPGRPVMGIGALSSPVLQLAARDSWIGWSFDAALNTVRQDPRFWPILLEALRGRVATALGEVQTRDLLPPESNVTGIDLEQHLLAKSRAAHENRVGALKREQNRSSSSPPGEGAGEAFPESGEFSSSTHLFQQKRAKLAAELLRASRALDRAPTPVPELLDALGEDAELESGLRIALREVRKVGLASRVLDLNVCGAVPPYGGLLTGKLVALAAASQELATTYRERYSAVPSVIASQLAGRRIVRSADFCIVTTTSLYGVASSQYNRLRVGVATDAGVVPLRWEELGRTEGISSVHFSSETIELLGLVAAGDGHRNVNYVFGEGTSPRLRKAREGLACLFSPVDRLLAHRSHRRIYALEIVPGARRALVTNSPADPSRLPFSAISDAWTVRWLIPRVGRGDALERVATEGPSTVVDRLRAEDGAQAELFPR